MKKHVKRLAANPLITGSSVMFLGTFFANIFNYGFSLMLGRLLPVADYGLVVSLASLITIFTLFQTSFANIFAKFSAQYFANGDKKKLELLINGGLQVVSLVACIVFGAMLISFPLIQSFLKVDNIFLLFLVAGFIFVSILYSLPSGILQGELKFFSLSLLNIFSTISKILVGTGLVLIGWGVFGAMSGYLISSLVPFLIGTILLFVHNKIHFTSRANFLLFVNEFKSYSFFFLLASLGISAFNSMDVILMRNIFDPVTSGQYAALSLMGKSIFYITAPIYFVFFPLISKKRALKEKLTPTLLLAGSIILLISLGFSLFYFLFPQLVVSIFYPAKEYAALAHLLGPYSLFVTVFSLAFLLHNYLLSIGKTGIYKINLICGVSLIVLFYILGSTLVSVVWILMVMSLVLFVSLLLYYFYHGRD